MKRSGQELTVSFASRWISMGVLGVAAMARADKIDFNRAVRPILTDNCFKCHGPDKSNRKAGLRLDLREIATKPLKSDSTAIIPGKPQESELIRRVTSDDPDEKMPPAK